MDRKTFIKKTAGAMIVAMPAYSILGCSSSDDGTETPDPDENSGAQGNCTDNGTKSAIGSNHGHTLNVSKEDVTSGVEKVYSIQGSSGHDHTVILSAANFNDLKSNKSISVVSTNDDGHTHSVNVSCA